MSDIVYVSKSHIERKEGPPRIAHLPGKAVPVDFSVQGAIAEQYKVGPPVKGLACVRAKLQSSYWPAGGALHQYRMVLSRSE